MRERSQLGTWSRGAPWTWPSWLPAITQQSRALLSDPPAASCVGTTPRGPQSHLSRGRSRPAPSHAAGRGRPAPDLAVRLRSGLSFIVCKTRCKTRSSASGPCSPPPRMRERRAGCVERHGTPRPRNSDSAGTRGAQRCAFLQAAAGDAAAPSTPTDARTRSRRARARV